jgi:hypothetical protein
MAGWQIRSAHARYEHSQKRTATIPDRLQRRHDGGTLRAKYTIRGDFLLLVEL